MLPRHWASEAEVKSLLIWAGVCLFMAVYTSAGSFPECGSYYPDLFVCFFSLNIVLMGYERVQESVTVLILPYLSKQPFSNPL